MLAVLWICLFAGWALGSIHYLFVGTVDGSSLYLLELDDTAKALTLLRNSSATGASPSIAVDRSRLYLFASRPADGTLSRYSVGPKPGFELKHEGTMDIPQSCNTTSFSNLKLTSGPQRSYAIYGAASTGTCSALFSISTSGYQPLRSDSITGDVRSFAWSPNGRHLHALDSQSSSLLDFYIADEPSLHELVSKDAIGNTTAAKQVITHPVGQRVYVVTENTNELLDIALALNDRIDTHLGTNRSSVLPQATAPGTYRTTSLAISASNATLWTLSHTTKTGGNTFIITAFKLDAVTGAVKGVVARASFKNFLGDGSKATSFLAPVTGEGDMVAFTTYPGAMVAVVGLVGESIKAFGRVMLAQDEGCCGESAWVD